MKHLRIIFLVACLVWYFRPLAAQNLPLTRQQYTEVKHFQEFIERFNYEKDPKGNPIDENFSRYYSHERYMLSLFAEPDTQFVSHEVIPGVARVSPSEFIKQIKTGDSFPLLKKYSATTKATAYTQVLYKGKPEESVIILQSETAGDGSVKWVIDNVLARFLVNSADHTRNRLYLSPVANETNFVALNQILTINQQYQCLLPDQKTLDGASAFFNLILNGDIVFQHVTELQYLVYDIPGWLLIVKCEKGLAARGWNISGVFKLKDSNPVETQKLIVSKKEYLQIISR